MGKSFYPDIHYQEKVYNQLVFKYQGEDLKKSQNYGLIKESKRCKCPQCGRHQANFFRVKDNTTFLMTCMEGCGLKKTLHQLVLDYGDKELKDKWKEELNRINRINFQNYGTAMPIKNAGRPKGSKTNKKTPQINEYLKDEIYRRRFRSTF